MGTKNGKKKIMISLLFLLITAFTGCGNEKESENNLTGEKEDELSEEQDEENEEEENEMISFNGIWAEPDNEEDGCHQAIIEDDTITIYWCNASDESYSLYWTGTFTEPEDGDFVSENYHECTEHSLMASEDDTKTFHYSDGVISYKMSIMGTTRIVKLEQSGSNPFFLEAVRPEENENEEAELAEAKPEHEEREMTAESSEKPASEPSDNSDSDDTRNPDTEQAEVTPETEPSTVESSPVTTTAATPTSDSTTEAAATATPTPTPVPAATPAPASTQSVEDQVQYNAVPMANGNVCLFMTNNSNVQIGELDCQMNFYDASGNILDTDKDGHDAVLPGYTVVSEMKAPKGYAYYEVNLDIAVSDNPSYVNHSNNVSVQASPTRGGVIVQVTNNDSVEIQEIEVIAVLYDGSVITGVAGPQDIFRVAPGETKTEKLTSLSSFSSYKVYLNQAHTFY